MILGGGVAVNAADEPGVPAIRLGRPIVRAQNADSEAAPVQLPSLGKPIIGKSKDAEPPPPREPEVFVERRPEPPPVLQPTADRQLKPAAFMLPAPESATLSVEEAQRPADAPVPASPQTPKPDAAKKEAVELAPMPHPAPALRMPGGPVPMHGGPVIGDVGYSRPATTWEKLKYKANNIGQEAQWIPARIKESIGLGMNEGCLLAPGLGCLDGCCQPDDCHRFYGSAEYLLWDLRSLETPPLVTTTTNPANEIGAIGQPGTRVLYGGEIDHGWLSGGRFTVGWWLDECRSLGIEAVFFFTEQGYETFSARSDRGGNPLLARPFLDQNDGLENVELVSDPGRLVGGVVVDTNTRLWGGELNLRQPLIQSRPWGGWCKDVSIIAGFRYLNLDDDIKITEDLFVIQTAPEPPFGTTFQILDLFHTENQFYGGQIGGDMRLRKGKWVIDLRTKLAVGVTHQEVDIAGGTVETRPGQVPVQRVGGLLAQRTNIGHYERNEWGFVSDSGINVGYQVTCNTRVFLGYSFLYWMNVARADQQIDRVVNSQLLSGGNGTGTRPAFVFRDRDFWAHGLNAGVEIRY
jgi:hypothetical protein